MLPSTVVFDHPTVRQLTAVLGLVVNPGPAPGPVGTVAQAESKRGDATLRGTSMLLPRGASSLNAVWQAVTCDRLARALHAAHVETPQSLGSALRMSRPFSIG